MAVELNPVSGRLRLKLQTGTDAAGNPMYRFQSYTRLHPVVDSQSAYDVATALADLQIHPLAGVLLMVENEVVPAM